MFENFERFSNSGGWISRTHTTSKHTFRDFSILATTLQFGPGLGGENRGNVPQKNSCGKMLSFSRAISPEKKVYHKVKTSIPL